MALLVMVFVSAAAARGEEGCTKDTDCKGERICVQRLCVAPATQAALPPPVPAALPPPVPAGDAAPAAYRDPVTPGPVTEPPTLAATPMGRSEERRVGKECRCGRVPYQYKRKIRQREQRALLRVGR